MESLKAGTLFGVEGVVAVITGGGSGLGIPPFIPSMAGSLSKHSPITELNFYLGLMIAKALDSNGAKSVYIIGRRKETLEIAAAQSTNGRIIPLVGDVTSKESLKSVASEISQREGYINVLVANSGVTGPNIVKGMPKDRKPTVKEIAEINFEPSMEDFTKATHVNCTGAFYTSMAFLELLEAGNKKGNIQSQSQIIITTSIAGFSRLMVAGYSYSVSKAAANALMKLLATDLAHTGIRANSIVPGLYPSEMTQEHPAFKGNDSRQYGSVPFATVPMTRAGTDEDMAGVALFLISRAGGYINGMSLVTDGGRLAMIPSTY